MFRKLLSVLLSIILLIGIVPQGCGNKNETNRYVESKDASLFDGPYDFVKVNDDGTITIKKDYKKFIFEFLGFQKGDWLAEDMQAFFSLPCQIWIEYDQEKLSPEGNLQGYAYYESTRVHDISTKRIPSTTYRMINSYSVLCGYNEFYNDSRIHKHYEAMLEAGIDACQDRLEREKTGKKPGPGTIFIGKTTKEIQSKLAEYEKMLTEYKDKKKLTNPTGSGSGLET